MELDCLVAKNKNLNSESNFKSSIILLRGNFIIRRDSEEVVQNAILNLTKNKTTLVIAHRLSTIHKADKIFVLKAGEIIDSEIMNLINNWKV